MCAPCPQHAGGSGSAFVCSMQPRMTLARTLKLFKLPEQPQTPGLRPLTPQDVPQVCSSAGPLSSKYRVVLTASDHASNRPQVLLITEL